MSLSDQSSNSHNNQNQLIAAFNAQQERIAVLENQLSQMIQSQQRSNITNNTLTLKPPKPDTFDGKHVDTFIFGLNKVFAFYNIPNENKVQLAVTYFRGAALRWYRYVESQSSNAAIINDWDQFIKSLKKHFEPSNTERNVRNKLNSLSQLGTVSKYNDLFNSLIIEILDMDEKTKIDIYCRGLKSNIQLQVMLKAPNSLEEAQITALNVDDILNNSNFAFKRNQHFKPNYRRNNYNSFNSSANQSTPMELGNIKDGQEEELNVMMNKKTFGNRLSIEEKNKLLSQNKCFKCKKVGHIARNCRGIYQEN